MPSATMPSAPRGPSQQFHPCIRVHGACPYGGTCRFALHPRDACLPFLMGNCPNTRCKDNHVPRTNGALVTAPSSNEQQRKPVAAVPQTGTRSAVTKNNKQCCLQSSVKFIKNKSKETVATPASTEHGSKPSPEWGIVAGIATAATSTSTTADGTLSLGACRSEMAGGTPGMLAVVPSPAKGGPKKRGKPVHTVEVDVPQCTQGDSSRPQHPEQALTSGIDVDSPPAAAVPTHQKLARACCTGDAVCGIDASHEAAHADKSRAPELKKRTNTVRPAAQATCVGSAHASAREGGAAQRSACRSYASAAGARCASSTPGVSYVVEQEQPPPPPQRAVPTVKAPPSQRATMTTREQVDSQLEKHRLVAFPRHPCQRQFASTGGCQYGASCSFAPYPRSMCLRYLKTLHQHPNTNAETCGVPECHDPHTVDDAIECSMTSPSATVPQSAFERLLHSVRQDPAVDGLTKHPCVRVFGHCVADRDGRRCYYSDFPSAMCLEHLKALREHSRLGAGANTTRCTNRNCRECHCIEDLQKRCKAGRKRTGGSEVVGAAAAAVVTMGGFDPQQMTAAGTRYVDAVTQHSNGERCADASSVLRAAAAPYFPSNTLTHVSPDRRAGHGTATAYHAPPTAPPYQLLRNTNGALSDGSTVHSLEVHPMELDFTHSYTEADIVRILPTIETLRPIGRQAGLQSCHLSALFFNCREDFAASLRRAVRLIRAEWRRCKNDPAHFSWPHVFENDIEGDVRHYQGATFGGGEFSSAGIVYHLNIDLSQYPRSMNWGSGKLMNGSLLLLSFDNFRPGKGGTGGIPEILMATIVKTYKTWTETTEAFNGDVDVKISNVDAHRLIELLSVTDTPISVLESTKFYLPYEQSLKVIRGMIKHQNREDEILGGLLLSPDPECSPPDFLNGVQVELNGAVRPRDGCTSLPFAPGVSPWPHSSFAEWNPETERACSLVHVLDPTQSEALEHLLTARVAIVQGPPGTGKTFIAEKYLQVLYQNRHRLGNMGPIVLACETNHAVDAVLHGIRQFVGNHAFARDIVRFGAKSKDPLLARIHLNSLCHDDSIDDKRYFRRCETQLKNLQSLLDVLKYVAHKSEQFPRRPRIDMHKECSALKEMAHVGVASFVSDVLSCLTDVDQRNLCDGVLSLALEVDAFVQSRCDCLLSEQKDAIRWHECVAKDVQHARNLADRLFPSCDIGEQKQRFERLLSTNPDAQHGHILQRRTKIMQTLIISRNAFSNNLLDMELPSIARLLGAECDDQAVYALEAWVVANAQRLDDAPQSMQLYVQMLRGDIAKARGAYDKWRLHLNRFHEARSQRVGLEAYFSKKMDRVLHEAASRVDRLTALVALDPLEKALVQDSGTESNATQDPTPSRTPLQASPADGASATGDALHDVGHEDCALRDEFNRERDIGDFDSDDIQRHVADAAAAARRRGDPHDAFACLINAVGDLVNCVTRAYCRACDARAAANNATKAGCLRHKFILAGTVSAITRDASMLRYLRPKVVVVEEAAEVREESIWSCLTESTQQLVLIGDHMQLSPKIHELRLKRNNFGVSLMERLVHGVGLRKVAITTQRRMHPQISGCIKAYYERQNIAIVDHRCTELRSPCATVAEPLNRVMFVDAQGCGVENGHGSWKNDNESICSVRLARLLHRKHPERSIVLLTMYKGQLYNMQQRARAEGLRYGVGPDEVRIATVDSFQGEESDIVILSPVRTPNCRDGSVGFLKAENRWCVALSRAKSQLYVVSAQSTLNHLSISGHVVHDLSLLLSPTQRVRHPSELVVSACTIDGHTQYWKDILGTSGVLPRCTTQCGAQRDCGHPCASRCHAADGAPCSYAPCTADCSKMLPCGHSCRKKCGKPCGPCNMKVDVTCHTCKRKTSLKCKDRAQFACQLSCTLKLSCGHTCSMRCGDKQHACTTLVRKRVESCGHYVEVECPRDPAEASGDCREVCGAKLPCGHACRGVCGVCQASMQHPPCNTEIEVQLPCGHQVKTECCKPFPLCQGVHTDVEGHGKRRRHKTVRLGRQLTSVVFSEGISGPCERTLPCKHPCLGLAGEACPEYCALCRRSPEGTVVEADAKLCNFASEVAPGNELTTLAGIQRGATTITQRLVQTPCCKRVTFVGDLCIYLETYFDANSLRSMVCFDCCSPIVATDHNHAPDFPLCAAYAWNLRALRQEATVAYHTIVRERVNASNVLSVSVANVVEHMTKKKLHEVENGLRGNMHVTAADRKNMAVKAMRRAAMERAVRTSVYDALQHANQPQRSNQWVDALVSLFMIAWYAKDEHGNRSVSEDATSVVRALCDVVKQVYDVSTAGHMYDDAFVDTIGGWLRQFHTVYTTPGSEVGDGKEGASPLLSTDTILDGAPAARQQRQHLSHRLIAFSYAVAAAATLHSTRRAALAADEKQRPAHLLEKGQPTLSPRALDVLMQRCNDAVGRDAFVLGRGMPTMVVTNPCLITGCSAFQRFAFGVHCVTHDRLRGDQDAFESWIENPENTRIVFHGTSRGAIAPIACRGFDINHRSGQAYGKGDYFGTEMATSDHYVKRRGPHDEMIVCLVIQPSASINPNSLPPRSMVSLPRADYVLVDNEADVAFVAPVGVVDYSNKVPEPSTQRPYKRSHKFFGCDYPSDTATLDDRVEDLVRAIMSPTDVDELDRLVAVCEALRESTGVGCTLRPVTSGSTTANTGFQVHLSPSTRRTVPPAEWFACIHHGASEGTADAKRLFVLYQVSAEDDEKRLCPVCWS